MILLRQALRSVYVPRHSGGLRAGRLCGAFANPAFAPVFQFRCYSCINWLARSQNDPQYLHNIGSKKIYQSWNSKSDCKVHWHSFIIFLKAFIDFLWKWALRTVLRVVSPLGDPGMVNLSNSSRNFVEASKHLSATAWRPFCSLVNGLGVRAAFIESCKLADRLERWRALFARSSSSKPPWWRRLQREMVSWAKLMTCITLHAILSAATASMSIDVQKVCYGSDDYCSLYFSCIFAALRL